MRIEIDTATTSIAELSAVMALCASLGGRLPASIAPPRPEPSEERGPRTVPANAAEAAEALLAHAERTRIAPPPPGDEDDGEPAADAPTADSEGLPWDARIHAKSKGTNQNGTWKRGRNVPDATWDAVRAELRATAEQTASIADPANAASAAGNVAPPPPSDAATLGNDSAPTAAASEAAPAATAATGSEAPPPPPAGQFADFASFVQQVSAITPGGIPYLKLNELATTLGVSGGFKDMKDHSDKWGMFFGMAQAEAA